MADAEVIFGVPFSSDLPENEQHRTFKLYFYKKEAAHLRQILKQSIFKHWIVSHFAAENNGLSLTVDRATHLFLIKHFLRQQGILCIVKRDNECHSLCISNLCCHESIMSLEEVQGEAKECLAINEFSTFLYELPAIVKPICSFQWELDQNSLRVLMTENLSETQGKQLQLLFDQMAQDKGCPFPIELVKENGEVVGFCIDHDPLANFLMRKVVFDRLDFDRWAKLARLMRKEQITEKGKLVERWEFLEKKRREERKQNELLERPRYPSQKRSKNPLPQDPNPVAHNQKKGGKKSSGKNKSAPAAQSAVPPQKRVTRLPPLNSSETVLARPASFEYTTASSPIKFSVSWETRPEPINGGLDILSTDHQSKVKIVQECLNRLVQLADCKVSAYAVGGARFFNGMLLSLKCETLPLSYPLRKLFINENQSSLRHFWSHHCFPTPDSIPLLKTAVTPSTVQCIDVMAGREMPDERMCEEAKKGISSLFNEFESFSMPWKVIFAESDPRPALSEWIGKYLTVLHILKRELSEEKDQTFILDAIAFYISRIGELIKHMENHSKEYRNLRNDILHCFEEKNDVVRETLHAKCLSLLDKLLQFKLDPLKLSSSWEPVVNRQFRYPIKWIAALLRWRLNEKGMSNINVHDPINLSEVKNSIDLRSNDKVEIRILPIRMADRSLGLLLCHFQNQKEVSLSYLKVDSDHIPDELIQAIKPYEVHAHIQPEKKELSIEDHAPLLIERTVQCIHMLNKQNCEKIGTLVQVRKKHLQLAFQNGSPEFYLRQFYLH